MEHTKGKLEVNECATNAIDIISNVSGYTASYTVVAQIINENDELTETDRANAEELARRWNAFEKDGLVDKLLVACKEAQKAIFLLYECNKDVEIALGSAIQLKKAEKAIEAAIAKAKA